MLHPLEDLPSSLPTRRIREEIERRVQEPTEVQEFELRGVHQGGSYALKALVFAGSPGTDLTAGVQGLMFQAQTVTIGAQIRDAAREKAGKYGIINFPFLIALSVETSFPSRTEHEVEALFGDKVWNVPSSGCVTESQKPNGLFTMTRDASPRYARVSAVLIYRFKWTEDGHHHLAHLYHNPHASLPVEPELFPEFPQLIQLDETTMGWINGKPDEY